MPELPPIRLDLTSLKSAVATALIAPVPPALGCIVGVGICHPNLLKTLLELPSLGYYTKLFGIVLAAYVAGMAVWLSVALATAIITTGYLAWRRSPEDIRKERDVRVKLCRAYCAQLGIAAILPEEATGREWKIWFATISASLDEWEILPGQMNFYSSVESAAVVMGVSMAFSPYSFGWLWVLVVLAFLAGVLGVVAEADGAMESDNLSAEILKRLESATRQNSQSTGNDSH